MTTTRTVALIATMLLPLGHGVVAAQEQQPGATQGGPSTGDEMMPPFNPQYFLGTWEVEWSPPDTGLIPGGTYTGTETVSHIDSRFLKVEVMLEGEQGNTLTGEGLIIYDWGLNGQSTARFVHYDAGFSVFQYGPLGGDLGGYYSTFWETPEIQHGDHTYVIKGRSYYVSPAAYRVNQQISIDGEDFFNFGIMWLTKETAVPAGQ